MSFCLNEVELLNEILREQQPQIRSAMTEQHMSKFMKQRVELMHVVEMRVYGNEVGLLCWIPETKQSHQREERCAPLRVGVFVAQYGARNRRC